MHDKIKVTHERDTRRSVLGTIAAAIVGIAKRAGGSLHHHPMPELRELGREMRRRHA
jgi:hypothetical protein